MLTIALPKGSLEEQTMLLFSQADLEVKKSSREYNPTISDPRIGKVKILRPQEIPVFVQDGDFDLGISGFDWVTETGADVIEVADMPYAKTGTGVVSMVLAVPDHSEVQSARDIAPGSRITTEFPNVTRRYFEELGIPVEVYFSYGATEAKVPDMMDALVDLTETGSTLRRNGLKIVDTVLTSTTRLLANKDAWADPIKRREIEEIRTLLLGVIEARGRVLLSMNVPEDRLPEVIAALPAMKHPTVSKLYGSDRPRGHDRGRQGRRQHPHPAAQGRRRRGHPRDADQQDRPLAAAAGRVRAAPGRDAACGTLCRGARHSAVKGASQRWVRLVSGTSYLWCSLPCWRSLRTRARWCGGPTWRCSFRSAARWRGRSPTRSAAGHAHGGERRHRLDADQDRLGRQRARRPGHERSPTSHTRSSTC